MRVQAQGSLRAQAPLSTCRWPACLTQGSTRSNAAHGLDALGGLAKQGEGYMMRNELPAFPLSAPGKTRSPG
eukprot:363694-Chlamydomonas_euryale.AAC.6